MQNSGYTYETSGFDSFLNRSIGSVQVAGLDAVPQQTNQLRYDSMQVSGFLGDTLQLGPVKITKQGLEMVDENGSTILVMTNE